MFEIGAQRFHCLWNPDIHQQRLGRLIGMLSVYFSDPLRQPFLQPSRRVLLVDDALEQVVTAPQPIRQHDFLSELSLRGNVTSLELELYQSADGALQSFGDKVSSLRVLYGGQFLQ